MPKFAKGKNSKKKITTFFKFSPGNLLIIFYQLTKFEDTCFDSFWDILITSFLCQKVAKGNNSKLEDLKVLRRSPDLFNYVKIGQGQLQLIIKHILIYHIWGLQPFMSSDLNNLMNTPSNSPAISEKPMFI